MHGRDIAEERRRILHGHLEHLVDVTAAIADLQRLAVVAPTAASVAGHVDIGQEVHLDAHHAIALAGLAAPPFHIETEASHVVAAAACLGHL